MEYKKTIILLALVVFLLSIAGVSASEIGDTIASENANTIELSTDNDIEDDLQTSEENEALASTDYDEAIAQTDTEVLGADSATYSDLAEEIGHSGDITLTHKNYTYDKRGTIIISEDNKVIDGNGAVIDMNGSTIRAFLVSASGVTIKNLTIINANYNGDGGAIYFTSSATSGTVSNCNFVNNKATKTDSSGGAVLFNREGTVTNCNFTGNTATYGGAIFFVNTGTVTNCNFTDNTASGNGGAIYIYSGSVENCNFTANQASRDGGAMHFSGSGTVSNCNFTGNTATGTNSRGGAVYFSSNGEVRNCNFTNNQATGFNSLGSAVYFNFQGDVKNCNFTDNEAYYGGAIRFGSTGNVTNCNFTANTATSNGGGAIYFLDQGTVTNCNFIGNNATYYGGAIYFSSSGTTHEVRNCNFTGNTATGDYSYGGAIYIYSGTVTNCNFTDNEAYYGGAIRFNGEGNVTNCNFTNNTATNGDGGAIWMYSGSVENCNFTANHAANGSAIYFYGTSATKTVSNSRFLNNRANAETLEVIKNDNNITITFTGQNNLLNAIYSRDNAEVTFNNVTYWGKNGITTISTTKSGFNKEEGQNITVGVVVNDKLVLSEVMVTDENGQIVLDIITGNNYYIGVRHDTDSYYTEAERTISNNTKFNVNVTSQTTHNRTVNITAKSNIPNEIIKGKLLFILPNGTEINATYADGGIWWAEHTFDDYGDYQVNASYIGLSNVAVNYATISIVKANSTVNVSDVVLYYGETKNVTVTAEGATGITAKVNENNVTVVNNYTIPISGLDAGNYTLAVTTIPDGNHNPVTKTVNIAVNKAATEIILANETLYLKAYDVVGDVAKLSPADAGNLTFTSSDEDIALVYDGTIWSRIKGNATVTVSFAGNDNYAASENKTITVYVSPKDASVSVENDTINLNVDDTCIINATANPRFLTVYYASNNQSVATVTDYGNVKAVAEGTAIITLTVGNGETYAVNSTNVTVTVSKIPTEINIDPASLDLFVGDETVIAANLTPANAGNVTFTSSDYDVVDFDDEGNVIAQGAGQAIITVSFAGDNKYATAENKTITVTVSLNDASVTVDNDTLDLNVGETYAINATKSPDTILLDIAYTSSDSSVATVNENGVVTAAGEGTAIITVEVGDAEIYAINSTNVTVTVSRIPTEIAADPITATYNANEYLVITLKDANGTPISGENITVDVNGVETYLTDENGSVKVSTNGLAFGIYDAKITFNGSAKYVKSANAVNVTIKKATPVINATAKTFKTTDKTKKYQVSLKDDNGNPMANAIVTLKVNGKTYYAKTDENGQATFRLTKLTMAATYTVGITYKGDDNYSKVFQKVKLTVKTAFKTVSKGSKDKTTVKKIQVALKSNGYYIKSNGHKLKVDGIYDIYTEKAVKQFQKANGLKVTGKVDENTALKLGII